VRACGASRSIPAVQWVPVLLLPRSAPQREGPLTGAACGGRVTTIASFMKQYFTAFKTVADVPLNLSKGLGQPLCTMRAGDTTMGPIRPDKKQLNDLKAEINHVVVALLGPDYSVMLQTE
jgi:hypothetical protein